MPIPSDGTGIPRLHQGSDRVNRTVYRGTPLPTLHVQTPFPRVPRVAGDPPVVGRRPGLGGTDGGDDRVEGVAAAVAHDDPAVPRPDHDLPGKAGEDGAAG